MSRRQLHTGQCRCSEMSNNVPGLILVWEVASVMVPLLGWACVSAELQSHTTCMANVTVANENSWNGLMSTMSSPESHPPSDMDHLCLQC